MKSFFFILLSLPGFCAALQRNPDNGAAADSVVHIFYQKMDGQPVWLTTAGRQHLDLLTRYFRQATYLGLDAKDYEPALVQAVMDNSWKMPAAADTFTTDLRITEAAIQFFSDIVYGRQVKPFVKFDGLPPLPDRRTDIATKLADGLLREQFSSFLQIIEPADSGYHEMKKNIAGVCTVLMDTAFIEIPVTSLKADSSNAALLRRLHQIGITDTMPGIPDPSLQDRIIKAQQRFNMLDDGVLRPRFLQALNVPLSSRLQELKNALNQLRWLYYYKVHTSVVLVNIPATTLVFYEDNKPVLSSRVITGKKSTPTPTLCSRITEVVLFPYWTVPNKIAVRELLPHIKRDRQYLDDNQYQILDKHGHITDPSLINWSQLGPGNFPYVIRQNTGCDNSLGIVKLNFFSPFDVYLHDTPGKSLFMLQQRFFSHGCVRVEEAVPLAHLLLEKKAPAMIALEANGSQPDQHPVIFPVPGAVYVFILYNTAWPDATSQIRFYDDVYGKN